ncbi:polyprenyl synthetase family protein [Thermosulfurimonas marina]|uniref:Polyprenyl synthetase family protein n=1 Tax=Thermosulfurimonas marina TaxID=2047767 RepID=A0A6H1WQQ4_9BACT|nr:polyprenyl synthetase family protein [Thermosulfurimonas marina]QJA05489.1 polyprenyl synthetase family protein [Thermosulfurimonas marina]
MEKERLLAALAEDLERIESALSAVQASQVPFINEVSHYILFAGGKRLRPLLTVLCARLLGYEDPDIYHLSVLFEYLHAATLLHDDVVDGAEFRRGRKAAHNLWGNQATILVGDYLYARALRIAVEKGNFEVLKVVTQTTLLMSEGEVLQLLNVDNTGLTEAEYEEVIFRKTAALMAAACECGGIMAGAGPEERRELYRFGRHLGLAFQITDDLLDYLGVSAETGKDLGTDFKEGKVTLPLIYALEVAGDGDRSRLLALLRDPESTPESFHEAREIIARLGGFEKTRRRAEREVEAALSALSRFPENPTRRLLEDLTRYILVRRR